MAKEFSVSREKDDKDLFIQKEREFFLYDSMADKTLHLNAIMGAFSCVKAMFNISVQKIETAPENDIREALEAIAKKYRTLVIGGPDDTWETMAQLQNDVNAAYAKLKEALK